MPHEISAATSKEIEPPTPALNSSSSPPSHQSVGRASPSPEDEDEDLEDYKSPALPPPSSLPQTQDPAEEANKKTQLSVSHLDSDTWPGESAKSICLCQPDPKVPRPRNAFILYRQHNQAAIVQQNPGLANPEISKIIGDHWRNLSASDKNHWKLLADEEKIRHQKQYPDYRYQPRRTGRNNSNNTSLPSSTETSPRKCPKCGGQNIQTSSIMTSSVSFPSGANASSTPYSPAFAKTPHTGSVSRFVRRPGSPPLPVGQPPPGRRPRPSDPNIASLRLVSPQYRRDEASPAFKRPQSGGLYISSPDPKRRRMTQATYAPVQVRTSTGPGTPFPFTTGCPAPRHRRQSLPRPDFMGPGAFSPVRMGPPPRPHNTQPHPNAPLTLAPLQNVSHADPMSVDTQAKSLEAMILSIPTLGKIRVLSKISPPLAPPGPTSPARQTRGLLIAIDAADPIALKQLTVTLSTNLDDFALKVFETPTPSADAEPSFQSYMRLMDKYHTLSTEVVKYITTLSTAKSSQSSPSPLSPKSFPRNNNNNNNEDSYGGRKEATFPIAIVPGYQVTWSDWFASHVSIHDAYSPMDHWQWGATLWRDIVGADVTVAVQAPAATANEDPVAPASTAAAAASVAGDAKAGKDVAAEVDGTHRRKALSVDRAVGVQGCVEVRLEDARCVVVKGEKDGVGRGSLRRVGFEIGEWVRGMGERRGSLGI